MKTFVEVGAALMQIRDERLYLGAFTSFEDYCRERWGMHRDKADRLISASAAVTNVTPIGVIPANEAQARPLTTLKEPEHQRAAWELVTASASVSVPNTSQLLQQP